MTDRPKATKKGPAKKWKDNPWLPDDAWRALVPETKGVTVNGVGERDRRQPTKIFWHRRPTDETFAAVQVSVTVRFNSVPALDDVYRFADRGPRKQASVAPDPQPGNAAEWTAKVRQFCLGDENGVYPDTHPDGDVTAELAGMVAADPLWFYEGSAPAHPNLILIGTVMDHDRLMQLPGDDEQVEGQLEVADQYNRGARVANWLNAWIREQGYQAKTHAGPWVGSLNMVPAAIAAGFGELGCHGSIINPVHGSALRLAAVETDMPLEFDTPDRFGADEFCQRCQVCANSCPPQAIGKSKDWVRGDYKWYVNFDKCLPYFNETYSCGICVAVCPWSTPGRAPKLADMWRTRMVTEGE